MNLFVNSKKMRYRINYFLDKNLKALYKKIYNETNGGICMDEKISRKNFLTRASIVGLGALVGGFATQIANADKTQNWSANKWPWPYVELDPKTTAQIAYEEWYRLWCGGTVIYSIFHQLAQKVGEPYKSFPIDPFAIFEGGLAGWGTLCGSVNGAAVVASCIIGPMTQEGCEDGHIIASNMLDWYSHANMPIFVPKNPKANKKTIVHTVSESPLCHISVGKWMHASGYPINSPERKDRCARVAASVAYKLV
ncbi:MAG: chain A iron centre cytochrome C protein [Desulfurella sp.]|nr:MAG: chain A iron centre cytochrome C protein [Desulfurella sp.]